MAKKVEGKKPARKSDNPRRTPTNPNGAGRHKKDHERHPREIEVQILASYFLTDREISAVLNVPLRTLQRNFGGPLKKGRDNASGSLKRKQFQVAMGGNVTMLIWLGKVWLGQKELQAPPPKPEGDAVYVYKTRWGTLDEFN
jgi:hypothetical protein